MPVLDRSFAIREASVRTVVVTLPLFAACTVSNSPEGLAPSPASSAERAGDVVARNLLPRRYSITELPTAIGQSVASRAICARRAAIGARNVDSINVERAIVLDANGVTQLGTLGGASSHGRAGNAGGLLVGRSATAVPGENHAFLVRDGLMTDLGTLGGAFSDAFAINNSDQIVGQSTLITGGDVPSHAALWEGCDPIDLGTLGGPESFARDINDDGVIVGTSSKAEEAFRAHAVAWRARVIEELPANGALHSQAVAINAGGTIAGFLTYGAGSPYHAVIWRDGAMIDLGSSAQALGLNDRGDVVGHVVDAGGAHAFLYTNGEMLQLQLLVDNATGWTLTQANDVCDDGRIVGNGTFNGSQRGFVLTPVP